MEAGNAPVAVEFRVDANNPATSELVRPFLPARANAAFMSQADVVAHLPSIAYQPQSVQTQLLERLGRSGALPEIAGAGLPAFYPVREPRTLRLLERIVAENAVQAGLINLVGFEWIELDRIIAGRLVTEGERVPVTLTSGMNSQSIARFCLFSSEALPVVNLAAEPNRLTVTSGVPLTASMKLVGAPRTKDPHGLDVIALNVQVELRPVPDPIRVFISRGRTIALSGLSRLVALKRAGVERALCAVSYGYGIDVLRHFPTLSCEILFGRRPPLITDFLDDSLSVTIIERVQRASARIGVDVTVPD